MNETHPMEANAQNSAMPEEKLDAATPAAEAPTQSCADGETPPAPQSAPDEGPALKTEIAELKDRLLRAAAEMENIRKRAERDRTEAARYSIQRFAADLVGVADNLGRALAAISKEPHENETLKTLIAGVELTERELLSTFDRHGIRQIHPKGEVFNAHFHQAVAEVPSADVASGHVLEVIQPGYAIDERLIRAAMVVVAKTAPAKETGVPELPSAKLDTSA